MLSGLILSGLILSGLMLRHHKGEQVFKSLLLKRHHLPALALATAAAAKAAACPDLPPQKARTSCIRWYVYHKYISSFFTQKKNKLLYKYTPTFSGC